MNGFSKTKLIRNTSFLSQVFKMAEKLEDFESEVGPMSSETDDLNVLMALKKRQIEEYRAETERMNKILKSLGLEAPYIPLPKKNRWSP
jgi:hypothetical protein